MNQGLIYLKIILIFIIVYSINKFFFVNEVKVIENFGNPLAMIGKIFKAITNFFTNIIDILFVFLELMEGIIFVAAIILDLFIMLVTWFHPISMIKSVISTTFMFVKIIILMVFDFFYHYFRIISEFLISFIKGGIWGIPHGPEQHRSYDDMWLGQADNFGDHVHTIGHAAAYHAKREEIVRDRGEDNVEGNIYQPHHTLGGTGDGIDAGEDYQLYRPLRCYKNIGANGYMNIFATIICPPLGVFMSYGMTGWAKIGLCAILCLAMYFPGLVYALLITAHRGLPGEITAKDCGPVFKFGQHFYKNHGGVIIKGCTARLTKDRCTSATIPGYESKDGDSLNACEWITDFQDPKIRIDGNKGLTDDNYRLEVGGEKFFIDPEAVGGEETNNDDALSSEEDKNTPFAETLINNMRKYGGVCINRNVNPTTPANEEWTKVAEI